MGTPEADATIVADVVAYLDNLPVPEPSSAKPALFMSLGCASALDWHTAPLWALRQRARYLHDGHAQTLEAAILAHAGEAEPALQRFRALSADQHAVLIAFLSTL